MDKHDWPVDCQDFMGYIGGYDDDSLIVTTSDTLRPETFTTIPAASTHSIKSYFDYETLGLTWKARVDNGPWSMWRIASPSQTWLHIWHNFRADSIEITDPILLSDSIYVGDTINVQAWTTPYLREQDRVKYDWRVTPTGAGHYRWGTGMPLVYKFNEFIVDSADSCRLYCIVIDTVSNYRDTTAYKAICGKAKLVIDKPGTDTTFWITDVPQMPQIICRAHIAGVDSAAQETLQFNWRISMAFNGLNLTRTGSVTGIRDWIPNFGTDFGGGYVTLDVGVKYGADSLVAHYLPADNVKVLGRNIQGNRQAIVEAFINSLTQYGVLDRSAAKGAACYETDNYIQFYETGPNNGFPYGEIGGGGGRGIMQLTFGAYVTRNSLWSWHENVRMGTQACHEVYGSAVSNFVDPHLPGYEPTALQVTKQMLAKYNGGTGIRYFKYYGDLNDFARDTTYCADCGACNSRTGEHFKTQQHDYDCIRDCVSHTPYCYSDGAYNCAH